MQQRKEAPKEREREGEGGGRGGSTPEERERERETHTHTHREIYEIQGEETEREGGTDLQESQERCCAFSSCQTTAKSWVSANKQHEGEEVDNNHYRDQAEWTTGKATTATCDSNSNTTHNKQPKENDVTEPHCSIIEHQSTHQHPSIQVNRAHTQTHTSVCEGVHATPNVATCMMEMEHTTRITSRNKHQNTPHNQQQPHAIPETTTHSSL